MHEEKGYGAMERAKLTSDEWSIASPGVPSGHLSRDGSKHVTDEVFNTASHLMAAMFALLGSIILISKSSSQGAPWKIVSFSIYGLSLTTLFSASAAHHSVTSTAPIMKILRKLDYMAIFPLIAGTFTPICLVFYHDSTTGWAFFGFVWALSIIGMCMVWKFFDKLPKYVTMTLYVTLGWAGATLAIPFFNKVGMGGISLLGLGGLWYTIGGVIFTVEKPNPLPGKFGFHEIWHIFVILGALSHWCLMFFYVLPWHEPMGQGGYWLYVADPAQCHLTCVDDAESTIFDPVS